ncbi:MAG: adenine methyltransferase [Pseudomonadota bacterium]
MGEGGLENAPYQVMPPPSDDDYAALEASIIEDGICKPVEYDEEGNILDGHTRVQIAQALVR